MTVNRKVALKFQELQLHKFESRH